MNKNETINEKTKWIFSWLFISSGIICTIVNIAVGWPAWSLITAYSLWAVWRNFVCCKWTQPVDVSRIARLLLDIGILLVITCIVFKLGIATWIVTISIIILYFTLKTKP